MSAIFGANIPVYISLSHGSEGCVCWRLKLEGESENMGVCTKERKGVAAEGLLATPCTNSLAREGDVDSKNGTHSS